MSARSGIALGAVLLLAIALFLLGDFGPGREVEDAQAQSSTSAAGQLNEGASPEVAEPATGSSGIERVGTDGREDPAANSTDARASLLVRVARHEEGGDPVANVWVWVYAWGAPNAYFAARLEASDANGEVLITDLAPGRATVNLHRAESGGATVGAELRAGEVTEVELVLGVGLRIHGVVVDLDAVPVADAEIWLSRSGSMTQGVTIARSDADGRFALEDVGSGHWIGARMAGHAPSVMPMVIAAEGADVELRIVLQGAGGSVAGRVVASSGGPVAGAASKCAP